MKLSVSVQLFLIFSNIINSETTVWKTQLEKKVGLQSSVIFCQIKKTNKKKQQKTNKQKTTTTTKKTKQKTILVPPATFKGSFS